MRTVSQPGLVVLGTVVLASAIGGFVWADDKPAARRDEHKEFDAQLAEMLRDVHNRGAELYNTGDWAGCYRMFQGALMALRPAVALHPDMQKAIDAGLAAADRNPRVDQRAFALHDLIEKVRTELRGGAKTAEKMPPGKKTDEAKAPKATEDKKTEPKKTEEKKSVPVTPIIPSPPSLEKKKPDDTTEENGTVKGKITYKGLPLAGGDVIFVVGGKETKGTIKSDGTFEVKSLKPGTYKVAIKSLGVAEKFADADKSGLTVEVKKGSQIQDINLQ